MRRLIIIGGLTIVVALGAWIGVFRPQESVLEADLILTGGRVWTGEDARDPGRRPAVPHDR